MGGSTTEGSARPGQLPGQSGVYGTLGEASSTNVPGARDNSTSWVDASGNFWLFGGLGADSTGIDGYLNDLWKYAPSTTGDTGEWTWMGGSARVGSNDGQPGVYGTLGIADPANIPGGRDNPITWVDASGSIWLFSGMGFDSNGFQGYLNDLWKFDPTLGANGEWTWMGGSNMVGGAHVAQPGVYGTQGTPASTNVVGGRYSSAGWIDASGNFWLFGGSGFDSNGAQGALNDLWEYQP